MQIAVGSGNPVKREAAARVFAESAVAAEPVPSGVSEQPVGHEETRRGARNRATAALRAGAYDLGVGIEGGVATFGASGAAASEDDDLFLVMWAAVTNGERWGVGAGPSLPLPEPITARVRDGEELGPVMDDVLGKSNVAEKEGAAGAFTDGSMSRTDALDAAVTAAASPFLSDLY
ncbi:inosine/xanthosine triphosphatase [Halobellus rufus]|uniref:inosine/xanthosine triphosphatase n=1 Tax=Halobellus rufus TaxID=1448860 RepID=UPI000678EFBD|nr:inosine/xanthosine triphosphatase [Halobellus rufus]